MIEIDNLIKSYGDFRALDNISLEIGSGEIFGLIGHNGAGKSTLIKILVSIISKDSGKVYIDDLDLDRDRDQIKEKIAYVSDSPNNFLKLTINEYFDFLVNIYKLDEDKAQERIGYLSSVFELEDLSKMIGDLSHGMKQKTFIIGALISSPDIWILDEPMTGLDPQASFNLKEMMKAHRDDKKTILFSTHVLEVAEDLCDRIGILRHGRLIFLGTMDDLRAKYPDKSLETIYLDMIKAYDIEETEEKGHDLDESN